MDASIDTNVCSMLPPLPAGWLHGTVSWFDESKGFGFITPSVVPRSPVFVEQSCIELPGYRFLASGQQVLYQRRGDGGRPEAVAVRPFPG